MILLCCDVAGVRVAAGKFSDDEILEAFRAFDLDKVSFSQLLICLHSRSWYLI